MRLKGLPTQHKRRMLYARTHQILGIKRKSQVCTEQGKNRLPARTQNSVEFLNSTYGYLEARKQCPQNSNYIPSKTITIESKGGIKVFSDMKGF